jgi:hypothetical protein
MSSKPSGGGLRLRDVRRGGMFAGCLSVWVCWWVETGQQESNALSQTIARNFTRAALTCDDGKSEGRLHFPRLADLLGSSRVQRRASSNTARVLPGRDTGGIGGQAKHSNHDQPYIPCAANAPMYADCLRLELRPQS